MNLDHKLSLSMSLGETGLQELTVVSKNSKINSSVSAADIIALKQSEEGRGKGLDGSFKHSRSVSDQILFSQFMECLVRCALGMFYWRVICRF